MYFDPTPQPTGICKSCGALSLLCDDGNCIFCEPTQPGTEGFVIVDKPQKDVHCTKCGAKKKWVELLSSRTWACPKC